MPQEDDGQFSVNVTMPAGFNLAAADAAVAPGRADHPRQRSRSAGGHDQRGRWRWRFWRRWRQRRQHRRLPGRQEPDASVASSRSRMRCARAWQSYPTPALPFSFNRRSSLGFGGGSRSRSSLPGPTSTQLTALVNQAEPIIRQVPGVVDVINNAAASVGETQLVVDRKRLADTGVTAATVATRPAHRAERHPSGPIHRGRTRPISR